MEDDYGDKRKSKIYGSFLVGKCHGSKKDDMPPCDAKNRNKWINNVEQKKNPFLVCIHSIEGQSFINLSGTYTCTYCLQNALSSAVGVDVPSSQSTSKILPVDSCQGYNR
ncbi:hypothetical protein SAY87_011364 [Trapa incisa]|uniref:Uncharacterized protein n=1 Tax=Trapa incisa TaxID=236973 RepID=A0AAN7GRT7_9MYRT|nr:hypothetical protein SAY87_011364 [Trapa incisa]